MKRSYILLLHLLVWLLLITSDDLTNYLQHPLVTADDQPFQGLLLGNYLLIAIGFNGVAAANFYGAYKWVGPPLFLHKQYLKAFLFAVLVLGSMVALRYAIEYGFFLPVLRWDNYYGNRWSAVIIFRTLSSFICPAILRMGSSTMCRNSGSKTISGGRNYSKKTGGRIGFSTFAGYPAFYLQYHQ